MPSQGWEYKLVLMGNPLQADVEERANAFGRLGWELVGTDAGVWIFKRAAAALEAASAEALVELTVPIAAADPPVQEAPP